MKWTQLSEVHVERFFSKRLKAQVDEINGRIHELQKGRADFDAQVQRNREIDVTAVNFDKLVQLKAQGPRLLQDELQLRNDLATVFEAVHEAYSAARTKAYEACEKAKVDVRAALVGIGYVDVAPTVQAPGKIEPGWILAHPKVHEARLKHDSLTGKSSDRTRANANREAIKSVKASLERVRDHAAALPGA